MASGVDLSTEQQLIASHSAYRVQVKGDHCRKDRGGSPGTARAIWNTRRVGIEALLGRDAAGGAAVPEGGTMRLPESAQES